MYAIIIKTGLLAWTVVLGTAVPMHSHRQAPKPCCMPDQWETTAFQQDASFIRSQDRATYQNTISKLSMDYKGERTAVETQVLNQTQVTYSYKVILDYKKKTQWVIVHNTCTKSPLPINMTSACIPDNAKSIGSGKYGGIEASTWAFQSYNTTSRLTVDDDSCYPLAEATITSGNIWTLSILNFQNVTAGIQDPTVFNVPDICNKADRTNQPHLVHRWHAVGVSTLHI